MIPKTISPKLKRILRIGAIALGALAVILLIQLVLISIQPPAAYKITAWTGSMAASVIDGTELAWSVENAELCAGEMDTDEFRPDDSAAAPSQDSCAVFIPGFVGTIWVQEAARVEVVRNAMARLRVEIRRDGAGGNGPVATAQDRAGNRHSLQGPLRIAFEASPTAVQALVLPVFADSVVLGHIVSNEEISPSPLLRSGNIMMARQTALGGFVFNADEVELSLGDQLTVVGSQTDPIAMAVIIDENAGFRVTASAKAERVVLDRFFREPVEIGAPLFLQLARDPSLIIGWSIGALLLGAWFQHLISKRRL